MDMENKRQRRDYFRMVNSVTLQGPMIKSKWSHIPITFTEKDLNLKCYPHTDAFVIQAHIDKCDIERVLIDNGSQADIIFYNALNQMNYSGRDLQPSNYPLYGFGGKRAEPMGKITLPVTFGNLNTLYSS